jgi:hypothetical protein
MRRHSPAIAVSPVRRLELSPRRLFARSAFGLLLATALMLGLSACKARPDATDVPTNPPDVAQPEVSPPPADAGLAGADGQADLESVANYEAVMARYGLQLSEAQAGYLAENRFLLLPSENLELQTGMNFDEMLALFDAAGGSRRSAERQPADAVLVTPDVVLHAYHKFFELTLEELERTDLNLALGRFLRGMRSNLAAAAAASDGTLRERYRNLEAQITLAQVLYQNRSPEKPAYFDSPEAEAAYLAADETVDSLANAETILGQIAGDLPEDLLTAIRTDLAAIYAADKLGKSALYGQYSDALVSDFTQFKPRSHYSKDSGLRAYFRTMMLLGRSSYFLAKDIGITDSLLLAGQFAVDSGEDGVPLEAWKKVMAVTGFYAGQSDDLTYDEWQAFTDELYGQGAPAASEAVDPQVVARAVENLAQLRLPKILSDVVVHEDIGDMTKADLLRGSLAFRIMGQRFTFDAWVLNDLTAGQEKVETRLPSTPSALFVPASFGDARAREHALTFLQQDAGFSEDELRGFERALDGKQADLEKVKPEEWTGDLGTAWLHLLGSLTALPGPEAPAYMLGPAFADKQIQTFLGSYAELKHDTLLYAKQSYAELGAGGDDVELPPVVKGFVEPNLEFWQRLTALVERTEGLFTEQGLFEDHSARARLTEFREIVDFYAEIAGKEASGAAISDDEYEQLRTRSLSFMAQPFGADAPNEDTGKVALIADIHSDALRGQILYEAVGRPYLMLAIVDEGSEPRLASGVAYNHYELTGPLAERLSDEDWKARVYDGAQPAPVKNFWYDSLDPR